MSEQEELAFFQGVQSANEVLSETTPDHAERVRNYYREQGRLLERRQIEKQFIEDSAAINSMCWYRGAPSAEEAFQYLLQIIRGASK